MEECIAYRSGAWGTAAVFATPRRLPGHIVLKVQVHGGQGSTHLPRPVATVKGVTQTQLAISVVPV